MVRYLRSGRVDKAHEDYLEAKAVQHATEKKFNDQRLQATRIGTVEDNDAPVRIVIDAQSYLNIPRVNASRPMPPRGLDRWTLMAYSGHALDYFSTRPEESPKDPKNKGSPKINPDELHLPVQYSIAKQDSGEADFPPNLKAYIRTNEIANYIIPWLQRLARPQTCPTRKSQHQLNMNPKRDETDKKPRIEIEIPENLDEKIHLYNALLQLSIAKEYQEPIINAINDQFDETPLRDCHLDVLELTVARFYSKGMPILDPVIKHFVQNYRFRTRGDRANPVPEKASLFVEESESEEETFRYAGFLRSWLAYTNVARPEIKHDTLVLPPQLEMLGHCIKHWASDVPEDEWYEVRNPVGQPGYLAQVTRDEQEGERRARAWLARVEGEEHDEPRESTSLEGSEDDEQLEDRTDIGILNSTDDEGSE